MHVTDVAFGRFSALLKAQPGSDESGSGDRAETTGRPVMVERSAVASGRLQFAEAPRPRGDVRSAEHIRFFSAAPIQWKRRAETERGLSRCKSGSHLDSSGARFPKAASQRRRPGTAATSPSTARCPPARG